MRTRTIILGLTVATLVVTACTGTGGSGGTGGTLDGKTWSLTSYAADGETKTVPAVVAVDATFDAATSTVSGSGGCNRYTGTYTADGAKLTFGPLATTMMACIGPVSAIETAYLANLANSATYTATADALTIYDASGASILVYAVAQPATLDGVTWHATAINNGKQAVVSIIDGTDPTAIFAADGTVSGNATCNTYNGPAVVDSTSIKVGPLMSTKMACADDAANAQEAEFLAALQNATVINQHGSILELRDAGDALQVMFEAR